MNELERIRMIFKAMVGPVGTGQEMHDRKMQKIADKADRAKEASKNNGKKRR